MQGQDRLSRRVTRNEAENIQVPYGKLVAVGVLSLVEAPRLSRQKVIDHDLGARADDGRQFVIAC